MRAPLEVEIELAAQELLAPLGPTAANAAATPAAAPATEDSFEIELTADEIDELLSATK